MALGRRRKEEDESAIDMTPMLDVVFIMLIFFIVTAVTIKKISMINTTSSIGVISIADSSSSLRLLPNAI